MKKNSQKLAPFRRHTEGYTGQKKTAFRDFKISYAYQKQVRIVISYNFWLDAIISPRNNRK